MYNMYICYVQTFKCSRKKYVCRENFVTGCFDEQFIKKTVITHFIVYIKLKYFQLKLRSALKSQRLNAWC